MQSLVLPHFLFFSSRFQIGFKFVTGKSGCKIAIAEYHFFTGGGYVEEFNKWAHVHIYTGQLFQLSPHCYSHIERMLGLPFPSMVSKD